MFYIIIYKKVLEKIKSIRKNETIRIENISCKFYKNSEIFPQIRIQKRSIQA